MPFACVAALIGEVAGKATFPRGFQTFSLLSLLVQGACFFRFLIDGEQVTAFQMLTGDAKVLLSKCPVISQLGV